MHTFRKNAALGAGLMFLGEGRFQLTARGEGGAGGGEEDMRSASTKWILGMTLSCKRWCGDTAGGGRVGREERGSSKGRGS